MNGYFSIMQRDTHHWDVSNGDHRIFRIRGEPGDVVVFDERHNIGKTLKFRSIQAAILFISDECMVIGDVT